jgi:polyphenol oxidase
MAAALQKERKTRSAASRTRIAPWSLRKVGKVQILSAPALSKLDWLVHGFSTRPGGESELPMGPHFGATSERVLNLGFTDWDERVRVEENRARFFRAVGAAEMRVALLRQIHSDAVHRGAVPDKSVDAPQGDALVTNERGVLLVVQTADCVPILLADTKKRAVAAIHSGWRGTLKRISAKALGRMRMEFGTDPEHVVVALGPNIAKCCYEVGHEVAREFHAQFANAREWFEGPFDAVASGDDDPNWLPWLTMKPPGHAPPPPRVNLDLTAANRAILAEAGVPPGQIFSSDLCTACRGDLFFSYRRERVTGRMMAAIGIR